MQVGLQGRQGSQRDVGITFSQEPGLKGGLPEAQEVNFGNRCLVNRTKLREQLVSDREDTRVLVGLLFRHATKISMAEQAFANNPPLRMTNAADQTGIALQQQLGHGPVRDLKGQLSGPEMAVAPSLARLN